MVWRAMRQAVLSREARRLELLSLLFAGLEPNQLFDKVFSVDMSELILVFGTIAITLGIMVVFGSWWQR